MKRSVKSLFVLIMLLALSMGVWVLSATLNTDPLDDIVKIALHLDSYAGSGLHMRANYTLTILNRSPWIVTLTDAFWVFPDAEVYVIGPTFFPSSALLLPHKALSYSFEMRLSETSILICEWGSALGEPCDVWKGFRFTVRVNAVVTLMGIVSKRTFLYSSLS